MNHFEIPEPGEFHIYRVITGGDKYILNDFEKRRCDKFSSTSAQEVYLKGHSAARFLTANYTGKNPSKLDLQIASEGKPYFQCTPDLNFNLSHSCDAVFIAFSSEPIGFDIEKISRKSDFLRLAERFFHPTELEFIHQSKKSKEVAFFELWTAKEAMLKLHGKGIGSGLDKAIVVKEEEGFFNETSVHLHRYHHGDFLGTLASFQKPLVIREFTY